MTTREAAIVSAYTGVLIGKFDVLHGYIEEIMECPIFTHQMGNKRIAEEIEKRSKKDFLAIKIEEEKV